MALLTMMGESATLDPTALDSLVFDLNPAEVSSLTLSGALVDYAAAAQGSSSKRFEGTMAERPDYDEGPPANIALSSTETLRGDESGQTILLSDFVGSGEGAIILKAEVSTLVADQPLFADASSYLTLLARTDGGLQLTIFDPSNRTTLSTATPITPNTPFTAVAVWGGGNQTIWLDGTAETPATSAGPDVTNQIVAIYNGGAGKLYRGLFYNAELTSDEITAILAVL